MIISFNRVRLLTAITAVMVISFAGFYLLRSYLPSTVQPAGKIVDQTAVGDDWFDNNQLGTETTENSFFSEYRMERERIRSKELTLLREISGNTAGDQKTREAAYLKLVNLVDREEKEMQAEALIKSQGFQDCVVFVNENNTTVMLDGGSLTPAEQEGIKKTVSLVTGGVEKNISVMKLQTSQ